MYYKYTISREEEKEK